MNMSTGILSSALLLVFNIIKRYSNCKCCSYIFLTMNLNSSMMHKNYVSYNSQSKSCSARFTRPCLIYPVKSFKYFINTFLWYSYSWIFNSYIKILIICIQWNMYPSIFDIIFIEFSTRLDITCVILTSSICATTGLKLSKSSSIFFSVLMA